MYAINKKLIPRNYDFWESILAHFLAKTFPKKEQESNLPVWRESFSYVFYMNY